MMTTAKLTTTAIAITAAAAACFPSAAHMESMMRRDVSVYSGCPAEQVEPIAYGAGIVRVEACGDTYVCRWGSMAGQLHPGRDIAATMAMSTWDCRAAEGGAR